jgi:L-iditol 2-dehydrogenase
MSPAKNIADSEKGPTSMIETGTTTKTTIPEWMRASVLTGVKTLSVEHVPTPSMAGDEVLVEVAAVGVCGSDTHYYRHGRIGDFVVTGPLILGHELSGRIVAVGEEVPESRVGERVAIEPQKNCRKCRECRAGRYNLCPNMEFYATPPIDGAFAQYCVIRTEFAHKIPDSMSDESAALLEPLSVAVTTMRKAKIVPASSILIAGAGPIGIVCAQAARAFGASEIIITDLVPERRERALRYGATRVLDPRETDVANAGLDVNAFVDASGSPQAVMSGIKAVRPAGAAVLVGLGSSEMTLPVEQIQNLEITVTGIFRYTDTWPAAIHLVASGLVELDSLVTGQFSLEHADQALESDQDPNSLKSVVYPNGYRDQMSDRTAD